MSIEMQTIAIMTAMNCRNVGVVLLLLSQMACSSHNKTVQIASDAQLIVSDFVVSGFVNVNKHIVIDDLIVTFNVDNNIASGVLGVCTTSLNGTPHVSIRLSYWNVVGYDDRRELLFHELGHCVLGLNHNDKIGTNGLPISIMYASHLGSSIYNVNTYSYYDTELFNEQREMFW